MTEVVKVSKRIKTSVKTGKPFTVHYITLSDGREVNVGFKQTFNVGDTFAGSVENKYGELQLVTGGAPAASGAAPAPSAAPAQFPVDLRSRENSICRQSALKAAVDTMGIYQTHTGTLDSSTSLEDFAERIITIAYKYADFSTGNRERKLCKASADLPE